MPPLLSIYRKDPILVPSPATRLAARLLLACVATACALVLPVASASAAGELDLTFSEDGLTTTSFGAVNSPQDQGNDVAIQADGKIVVVGLAGDPDGGTNFALTRYNPDGSLDTSFGGDGRVTTDFGDSSEARAVAIQADGKIVVAGFARSEGDLIALARYLPADGSLDDTFDGDGMLRTNNGSDRGEDVVIQPDGKIVVASRSLEFSTGVRFQAVRFLTNGDLDEDFGDFGFATQNVQNAQVGGVALYPDGRVLLVGSINTGSGNQFALVRFEADGDVDGTFGSDGRTTTDFGGSSSRIARVVLQPDGRAVVVGTSGGDLAVARYLLDGTLDTSFSEDGKQVVDFFGTFDEGADLALQPDGKVVAVGAIEADSGSARVGARAAGVVLVSAPDFGLVRLNRSGSLDNSFSGDGKVRTDFNSSSSDRAAGVALQADGRIVVAGASNASGTDDFAVARYLGDTADLSITKSDSPDPVDVGSNLTYTVVVRNAGPDSAATVNVRDELPAGVELVSATPSQGTCSGSVTCELGALAADGSAQIGIVVRPGAAGTITNVATVSSATRDPSTTNNRASEDTTVRQPPGPEPTPEADLAVTLTDAPDPVVAGERLTYRAVVTNNGPDSATGVELLDTLPAGVKFVSAGFQTSSSASRRPRRRRAGRAQAPACSGTQVVRCQVGTLVTGASRTLRVVVETRRAGTLNNTVSVTGEQSDPAPDNNMASAQTRVTPAPVVPPRDRTDPRITIRGVRERCVERAFRAGIVVEDRSRLSRVEVMVGGRRLVSTRRRRFTVPVPVRDLRRGGHLLVVRAVDEAGNRGTRRARFVRCAAVAPRFTG